MDNDRIKKLVDISYINDDYIGPVYHYTGIGNIPKIFCKDTFCLRFTRCNDFEDKTEGVIIEEFYKIAVSQLYNEKIINYDEANRLLKIRIPDPFTMSVHGKVITEPYVMCFSKEKNSEYMYENYIKQEDKKGCCIGFYSHSFRHVNHSLSGYRLDSSSIIYGDEAIEYIYVFLRAFIDLTGGIGTKDYNTFEGLISQTLSKLKFFCKDSKYKNENEYRIILHYPIGVEESEEDHYCCVKSSVDNKHYLLWFPDHTSCSLESFSVNSYVDEIDRNILKDYLFNISYSKIIEKRLNL